MSDNIVEKVLTKICKGECGKDLPLENYHFSKHNKYGRATICKPCRVVENKKKNNVASTEGNKICKGTLCKGKSNPVKSFAKHKTCKDGLHTYCIKCTTYDYNIWYSTLEGFITKIVGNVIQCCRTRGKKLEVTITIQEIINLYHQQEGKCALTGHILTHTQIHNEDSHLNESVKHRWNISIDRIDSSKGYHINNVQLVGTIINRIKSDLSTEDFIHICQTIGRQN